MQFRVRKKASFKSTWKAVVVSAKDSPYDTRLLRDFEDSESYVVVGFYNKLAMVNGHCDKDQKWQRCLGRNHGK